MSTSPFLPADDPRAGSCATCRAPMAADQRYCLSCGARRDHARLPFQDALVPTTPVGPMGPGGLPPALWAAPPAAGVSAPTLLAALACVLLAFGVGILVGGGNGGDAQQPIVVGGAPATAAPVAATTTEDTTASAADDDADDASDEKDAKDDDPEPPKNLDAAEKQEAAEIQKTPAKVPEAKKVSKKALEDLNSKDPDKAREASQSLPDVVSVGGE